MLRGLLGAGGERLQEFFVVVMSSARVAAVLKEYGWGLNLVFIALGAYFVAGAVNSVVARAIRIVPTVEDMPVSAPSRPASGADAPAAFGLLAERNLFAIKREDLNPQPTAEATPVDPGAGCLGGYRDTDLRTCSLGASLRATLVAEGAPEWSMAVVVNNTTREPEVYTINVGQNELGDDSVLCDIRPREIVVWRRDHFELCSAEGVEAQTTASVTPPPPSGDQQPADVGASTGGGEGVSKVSETQYNVDGKMLDEKLSDLSTIATQARVVPSFQNGKANGFKLFSIKPGSIYQNIGLQNGDVIQKINGYEINSPDRALEIYQKLRDASSVQVELKRRGRDMTFSYDVRR